MMGKNQVRERYRSVAPVASIVLTPALSSNAINPSSARPVPPGIGDRAITTRTSENATSASQTVRPCTSKTTAEVHKQIKPAAKVPTEAAKITAHLFRNNSRSPTRISAENASGCVRSTTARVRINRCEILRSKNALSQAENLPTSKKSFADRNAIHQKTSENK